MFDAIGANRDRVAVEHILPKTTWRSTRPIRVDEVTPRQARPVDELVRD
jgi:hypothetical protein